MAKQWRLILDSAHPGDYNMAVDEALLRSYFVHKIPVLRIYTWQSPWITLGYNQKAEKVLQTKNIPFVRRITGGASIYHDHELTYSLVCCLEDLDLPRNVKESYQKLCGFLIDFYAQLGLEAKFAQEVFSSELGNYQNFCFSTFEHFDLIIGNKKIGGNAQKRIKNIIFQQGSIPQRINFSAIRQAIYEVGALEDKTTFLDQEMGCVTDFSHLRSTLAESFKKIFAVEFIEQVFFHEEKNAIQELLDAKYTQKEWNELKNIPHAKTALAE